MLKSKFVPQTTHISTEGTMPVGSIRPRRKSAKVVPEVVGEGLHSDSSSPSAGSEDEGGSTERRLRIYGKHHNYKRSKAPKKSSVTKAAVTKTTHLPSVRTELKLSESDLASTSTAPSGSLPADHHNGQQACTDLDELSDLTPLSSEEDTDTRPPTPDFIPRKLNAKPYTYQRQSLLLQGRNESWTNSINSRRFQ
ncbi:hypothetical protein CPB84DRAFT_756485 [Gymnopilus junonius]|uniref:Uncharacterized protein n=1 Tax=Gymnopilus junonius TaxID=109634 RepID=A0A9P5NZN6_GYMJU|nr:hypothetical protein CPB84DRAFT_756485 [Gymnopilus junonius]